METCKQNLLTASLPGIVLLIMTLFCFWRLEVVAGEPNSDKAPARSAASINAGSASTEGDAQTNAAIDAVLGDHISYRRVFDGFTKAVANHDVAAAASFVRFPIGVDIDGKKVVLNDASSFAEKYDRFMSPAMAKAISESRYADALVNDQGVMLGQGEVWISGICGDDTCKNVAVAIVTIQAAIP